MAKEYTGFPISNFRTGFDEALEPWLLPRDAFQVLKNAHLYRGVVEKIPGYSFFARMSYRTQDVMSGALNSINKTFTYQMPSAPTTAGTVIQSAIINTAAIDEIFTDDGTGILTGTNGGTGTINYIANDPVLGQPAGYVTVTFGTSAPLPINILGIVYNSVIITYDNPTGILSAGINAIMGIKQYFNPNGSRDVLVFNTRRMGKLVSLNAAIADLEQSDYGIQEIPHEIQQINVVSGFDGTLGPFTGNVGTSTVPGQFVFKIYDSNAEDANLITTITDNSLGALVGPLLNPAALNLINYTTGEWRMTFSVGNERPATDSLFFSGAVYGDIFTGDFTNFFSVINYQGDAFLTNSVDPPMYYDGVSLHYLNTNFNDLTSGLPRTNTVAPYDISKVLHVAVQRERLLLISPYVSGLASLNNIYWSAAGNPKDFGLGENLPAPTSQPIRALGDINTDLIIRFSNSERVFRYTGDAFSPFRWDSTNVIWRCDASFSSINYDSWFSSVGKPAIVGSDGVNVKRADEIIPDFTLNLRIDEQQPILSISQTSIGQCYGERFDDFKEGWLCYRAYDQDSNTGIQPSNNVLAFSYLDETYSIYTFPFSVLGYGQIIAEDTWGNDFTPWELDSHTWDSYSQTTGALIDLAGDQNGIVYQLGIGVQITDMDGNPTNCLFEAITKDFNPFVEGGELARFGYVDFLLSSNTDTSFRVQFYKNNEMDEDFNTYYQESKLTLPGAGQSKIWKRIYVGAVAKEHTMRIYQNEEDFTEETLNQPIRIHAMIPYFKPAGRIFG